MSGEQLHALGADGARRPLQVLDLLTTSTPTPVLLHLHARDGVDDEQRSLAAAAIESFLIRRMVCGLTTKDYNRLFLSILQNIRVAEDAIAGEQLVKQLADQSAPSRYWPDDTEFYAGLLQPNIYRVLRGPRLRVLLGGMETALRRDKSEQQFVPAQVVKLNVEHLIPQKWSQYYPLPTDRPAEEAEQRRNVAVHKLGNLTLTTTKLNSSISNGSWPTKRKELNKHAVLLLTPGACCRPLQASTGICRWPGRTPGTRTVSTYARSSWQLSLARPGPGPSERYPRCLLHGQRRRQPKATLQSRAVAALRATTACRGKDLGRLASVRGRPHEKEPAVATQDPSGNAASTLVVPPQFFSSTDAAALIEDLRQAGFDLEIQANHRLRTRGASAVQEVWLVLSDPAVTVLLGAGGSGLWEGIATVLGRRLHRPESSCQVHIKAGGHAVDLVVHGTPKDIETALRAAPELLRAAAAEPAAPGSDVMAPPRR